MVWDEFHRDAGAGLEVRLPRRHRGQRPDRYSLFVDHEKEKISGYICKELDLIGITSKMKGRKYIHDAILYLIENEDSKINVIRYLSNEYKKSTNTITNGIQNAILHAWRNSAVEDLLEYYTARINPETGVPTPMELIYYYVEKIKREL